MENKQEGEPTFPGQGLAYRLRMWTRTQGCVCVRVRTCGLLCVYSPWWRLLKGVAFVPQIAPLPGAEPDAPAMTLEQGKS